MSRRVTVTVFLETALLFLLNIVSLPALAQTSVGFANPHDLGALLAYRLPAWGYNSATLGLRLSGSDQNSESESAVAAGDESLSFTWYRESEKRTWNIFIDQTGQWNWRSNTSASHFESIESALQGDIALGGSTRNYLSGNTYTVARGQLQGTYYEYRSRLDNPSPDPIPDYLRIDRPFRGLVQVGAGVGRYRDVAPLIEAERLNERLRALGRQSLSLEQSEQVAQILARNGGYRQVFDRPDRRLWRDALGPLIGSGGPLSPYEVLYLKEASFERLGYRFEGRLAEAGLQLARQGRQEIDPVTTAGPWVAATWAHNFSLDHQLSASLTGNYLWYTAVASTPRVDRESASGLLWLNHLWVVADRIYWSNTATASVDYRRSQFSFENRSSVQYDRSQKLGLATSFAYYVEDHLSLVPEFSFTWNRVGTTGVHSSTKDYRASQFRLGLNYRLAGTLL